MRILDGLIFILSFLIAALLLTGGLHYATPTAQLELSQIDAFAWSLVAMLGLRRKLAGTFLPAALERRAIVVAALFRRRPRRVIGSAIAVYVALHTWALGWRYDSFHANAFDLSFVEQALWSTTRLGFLHSSLSKSETYLGEHFSPLLALVALPYRLYSSPWFLFFIQSITLASGAALSYALCRVKKLDVALSVTVALCFLAYQPLRMANLFDFREDNLFVPLFLGVLLALETRRWPLFWGLCLASWLIKENAPIFTSLIGAWLLLEPASKRGRPARLHGVLLGVLSLAAFLVINMKITPHFAGATQTMAAKRLRNLGETNQQILTFALTHPFDFAREILAPIFQKKSFRYFLNVALPFVFFAPAAPWCALVVAAGIGMNLIVNQPTIGFHYECLLIPFLFYVLIAGLAQKRPRWIFKSLANPTGGVLLALSFLLFFGRAPLEAIRRNRPTARDRAVARALELLPPGASVATQSVLHPHLTHRRDVLLFSEGVAPTDFIVADLDGSRDRYATPNLERDLARIDPGRYTLVIDRDGLKIWERKKQ